MWTAIIAGILTFLFTTVLTIAGVGAAFILIRIFLALGIDIHTAVASALAAVVGAWLMTEKLSRRHVKLVVGIVLLGIAGKMLWGLLA